MGNTYLREHENTYSNNHFVYLVGLYDQKRVSRGHFSPEL